MPIAFPLPALGSAFDRYSWKRGALAPQQRVGPNLARVGRTFSASTLAPGLGSGVQVPVNVGKLGKFYQHGGGMAVVNPAAQWIKATSVNDGSNERSFLRELGAQNLWISGVSRDSAGAVLGNCQVLVFRTESRSLVAETTSDGSGNWSLTVNVGGPFFLVEYKAGAPDVAGTSRNDLVPVKA